MISQKQIEIIESAGCVAVILAGSIGAVAVIRSLGMEKIPCIVIGNSYHHKSKYTTVALQAKTKKDVINLLLIIPKLLNIKPVLLTDTDEYLDIVYSNWKKIEDNYFIPASQKNYALIDKNLVDKVKGIHEITEIPITFQKINEVEEQHFPIIIKPLWHSGNFSQLKTKPEKIYVCNDKTQAKNALEFLSELNISSIIQQMIIGETDTLYTVLLYRNAKGEIEVGYTAKKLRVFPSGYGVASTLISVENTEIINQSVELMNLTDYQGVAEFEFKFCRKTNKYYLIEVNGRFPLQTSMLKQCNSKFIYTVFCDLLNDRTTKEISKKPERTIVWIFLLSDIKAIKEKNKKTLLNIYLKTIFSYRIQGALWSLSDPLPAMYFLKYIMKKIITKQKVGKSQFEKV